MPMIKRRTFMAGAGAALLARPSLAQTTTKSRTLRIVPQADLANLDPIWTPAAVTNAHGYTLFDTLYALDENLQVKPQMAEGHEVSDDQRSWTIRLREGLKFHDGEPVRSRDCIASLQRWSKKDALGGMLSKVVDSWEAPDDRTIRIKLTQPFPRLLDAIGKRALYTPFMMPERLAQTDPGTQITEMVGSGPYRFLADEWSVGNSAAYARFEDYVPRNEPPRHLAGGKHAHFDRIEWKIIPDGSTAAAALMQGEVDWIEQTLPDLNPMLAGAGNIRVEALDNYGVVPFLRFNTLHPPFNNGKIRHALLGAIDQQAYLQAVTGGNIKWRTCASMFPCGIPFSNELGAEYLGSPPDFDKVRKAVEAAGYNGERVVIMNPSDFASIKPLGEVTADAFQKAGINVDLQVMDWGTLVQRRGSKKPIEDGGWNIFHSWAPAMNMLNPVLNDYTRGLGDGAYFGWYKNDDVEKLVTEWMASDSDEQRQSVFDSIQAQTWAEPPYIPLGQYFPTTAYANDLEGRILTTSPLPWGIRRV